MANSEDRPLTTPIYHYTTLEVLTKIVESGNIHASNVFYMNDASEIRHGIRRVQQLSAEMYGIESNADDKEILRHLVGWVGNRQDTEFPFFAACFSEKRDDLNQWRSYAAGPNGVCIGFDAAEMHDCFREQGWDFMHVYYQPAGQRKWANSFITRAMRAAKNLHSANESAVSTKSERPEGYYSLAFESELPTLLEVASRMKHPAFSEEREWRLTSRLLNHDRIENIGYRVGRSMLVPYLPFRVIPERRSTLKLAEVILPRSENSQLSLLSLRNYLRANNVDTNIAISGNPYREL